MYALLITEAELNALLHDLHQSNLDPLVIGVRKRLIRMKVDAEMEPKLQAMDELEEKMSALAKRLRG